MQHARGGFTTTATPADRDWRAGPLQGRNPGLPDKQSRNVASEDPQTAALYLLPNNPVTASAKETHPTEGSRARRLPGGRTDESHCLHASLASHKAGCSGQSRQSGARSENAQDKWLHCTSFTGQVFLKPSYSVCDGLKRSLKRILIVCCRRP